MVTIIKNLYNIVMNLSLEAACISIYINLASCESIAAAETSLVVAVAWQQGGKGYLEADKYFPASSVLEELSNSVNVCFGFTGWFMQFPMK